MMINDSHCSTYCVKNTPVCFPNSLYDYKVHREGEMSRFKEAFRKAKRETESTTAKLFGSSYSKFTQSNNIVKGNGVGSP